MFNNTSGGKKTKKKTRKNKKTHRKIKGNTKHKKKIRKTHKINQEGGDFGVSAIIALVFLGIIVVAFVRTSIKNKARIKRQEKLRLEEEEEKNRQLNETEEI